jgi:hypothetical protein
MRVQLAGVITILVLVNSTIVHRSIDVRPSAPLAP